MQQINADDVRLASQGKWFGLYEYFGINHHDGKHGSCPICPDRGEDRFRIDGLNDDGRYICNQCGAGTAFQLLMKVKGWSFPETMKQIVDVVGGIDKVQRKYNKVDPGTALRHLYKSSVKLTSNDMVTRYLRARGLNLFPEDIRYCPQCYESHTRKKLPAMLAVVRDINGEGISIHRTYLHGNKKADIPSPRKLMTGVKPLQGCAVRLFNPNGKIFESDKLGVAEGIETAIAASQMFQIATWACISTSILENFVPPKEFKHIIIFGDNDPNFAGHKSAYILANKLYRNDYLVEVRFPIKIGDWNDELQNTNKRY